MTDKTVQVAAIENNGPNTLVSFLRHGCSQASAIDIAVAFVSTAGLDSILHVLQKTAKAGRVRLLTGLYQGITEPKALRTLFQVQKQTKGRLSVQISCLKHFHWKSYYILTQNLATAIIGSSNLTDDGLRTIGELNVVLTLSRTSTSFKHVHNIFERNWATGSKVLSKDIIERYEKWRKENAVSAKHLSVPVSQIVGKPGGKLPPSEVQNS